MSLALPLIAGDGARLDADAVDGLLGDVVLDLGCCCCCCWSSVFNENGGLDDVVVLDAGAGGDVVVSGVSCVREARRRFIVVASSSVPREARRRTLSSSSSWCCRCFFAAFVDFSASTRGGRGGVQVVHFAGRWKMNTSSCCHTEPSLHDER
jgi:hypothetical protein